MNTHTMIVRTGDLLARASLMTLIFVLPAVLGSPASAAEVSFKDFPFLVHCERDGVDRVFYLSRIGPDNIAVYISPDRQAGIVTIDGTAQAIGGDWSGSCAGKTIKQLRADGQAFDVQD